MCTLLSNPLFMLKRGIVLFWAAWFSLATTTNIFDFLKHNQLLSENWLFVSNNFYFIKNVISIYGLPPFIGSVFILGAIIIEIAISILFWSALVTNLKKMAWLNLAFTLSTFLWASFLVAEEIFIAYQFEQGHLLLLTSQLICLIAIHVLPNEQM